MNLLENSPKISEIESRLAKYTFLSRNSLPGYLDGLVFLFLLQSKAYPDRTTHPHFYHWYILMRQFAPATVRNWVERRLYFSPDDALTHLLPAPSTPRQSPALESPTTRAEEGASRLGVASQMIEAQYMIDILLKECSEETMEQLRRCLQGFRVEIVTGVHSRQVRVLCGESARRQELVNLISRTVEYSNLLVKKCKSKSAPSNQTSP